MKKLLFFGLLGFFAFSGQSQVVVTANDIIGIGDTAVIATDTNAAVRKLQQTSDTALVWDFTDLQADTLNSISYEDTAGTPYASDFPSANMYQYQDNSGRLVDANTYIYKDETGFTMLGMEGDLLNTGTIHKVEFTPNGRKQFFFPLKYTNGTDTMGDYSVMLLMLSGEEIGDSSIDSVKIKMRVWQRVNVDAFGTVKLPNAEYDCVRENRATHNIDSIWILMMGSWNLVNNTDTIVYQYTWFTNNDSVNYPVAQVNYDETTNKSDSVFRFFYVKKGTDTTQHAGINTLNAEHNLVVYPNPTTGQFYVKNINKGDRIEVYSITGAKLMEKEVTQNFVTVNLSEYNSGVYFVKIHTGNKIIVRKLILK